MPRSRLRLDGLDRALLLLVTLISALWIVRSVGSAPGPGLGLVQALLLLVSGLLVVRRLTALARWLVRKLLWRVRHRMIAVFFFVGALPISLGALVVAWGIMVLLGPLTAHLITVEFSRQASRMQAMAAPLLWQLHESPPSQWSGLLRRFHARAEPEFPGLMLQVELAGRKLSHPQGALAGLVPAQLPEGGTLILKDDAYFVAAAARAVSGAGRVIAVASASVSGIMPDLGILEVPLQPPATDHARQSRAALRSAELIGGGIPAPAHALDWQINWPVQTSVFDPGQGQLRSATFLLRTRPSALWQRILAQETELTFGLFTVLGGVLAALFIGNLFVSLLVAISLTRTLTRAVNDLYVGTTHLNKGDFGYRIEVRGTDQISDLSRSFNTMAASLERLMEDSRRRQQLEAELEIAREVQVRLFPASAPELPDLEMLGVCRPARSVSGDFFDYLSLESGELAISFGDVSGKGISAALVMASLHSILRTQIALLRPDHSRSLERGASQVMERTNQQLWQGTAPDKFSTLFLGAYNPADGMLTYANAGHLPPLLLRGGEFRRLDVGGMIVGAFPHARYSATSLRLLSGDLLVAYTDGLTEPENARDEEYGEARLQRAIGRHAKQPLPALINGVMDNVVHWTGNSTLQDDMTMLVLRKR